MIAPGRGIYRADDAPSTFDDMFTFSRAGNATMIDPADGALKWAPHALFGPQLARTGGEDGWALAGSGTVTGSTGNRVLASGGATWHRLRTPDFTFQAGVDMTLKAEVTAGTSGRILFTVNAGASGRFDLSGALAAGNTLFEASLTAVTILDQSIEDAGNGRLVVTVRVRFDNTFTDDIGVGPHSATTGEDITLHKVWAYRSDLGGMVNDYDTGSDYVENETSGARYRHRIAQVSGETVLLVEAEGATNHIVDSAVFVDGDIAGHWPDSGTENGITITKDGTGVEDGIPYVDYRVTGTPTGGAFNTLINQGGGNRSSVSTDDYMTASLEAKCIAAPTPGSGVTLQVSVVSETAPATFVSQTLSPGLTNANTEYVQEKVTGQAAGATDQFRPYIAITAAAGVAIDVTFRIRAMQFEDGRYVSSHIPTFGASASRAAESCVATGMIDDAGGTVFVDVLDHSANGAFPIVYQIDDGVDNDNRRNAFLNAAFETLGLSSADAGVTQGSVEALSGVDATQTGPFKAAFRYKADDFAGAANGGTAATDTSGTLAAGSNDLRLATQAVGTAAAGRLLLRELRYFPPDQNLSDAQLQGITA